MKEDIIDSLPAVIVTVDEQRYKIRIRKCSNGWSIDYVNIKESEPHLIMEGFSKEFRECVYSTLKSIQNLESLGKIKYKLD